MNNFNSILFVLLLYVSANAFGQAKNGVIRGKVVEEIGGLPIPYAVISITDASADIPFQTLQTDEFGGFRIEALKPQTYKVKVTYVGFANLILSDISITKTHAEYNLGLLKLTAIQSNLSEVIITADKPLIENDGDIIVYNVGNSIYAEGASAVDILKDVPLVEIDIDGKPSISGMRSTRIFINGRPSDYMTANITDLLNVLPSDAVEKIEVMTNPPAKYAADGEGIINIVLRKDYKVGFNGSAGIGFNTIGNKDFNTGASYRGKNFAINGGGTLRHNVGKSSNKNYRTNFTADTTYYYNQFSNSLSNSDGVNAKLGFDWDIDKKKKHNLKTNFSFSKNDGNSETFNNFYYINQELIEKRLRRQQNTANTGANTFVGNIDYALRLDTSGQKIDVHFTANHSANNGARIYDYIYVFPQNLSPYLQHNLNDVNNNGVNFNIDYEKPFFNKRDRLEVGFALNVRENDNNQAVQTYNFRTNTFVDNARLSSNFNYNEKIYAAYASYTYKTKQWTAKAALRSEYTNVDFDLLSQQKFSVNPYLSTFPSLSINRRVKKNMNFGLSYGLRVNRPRENTLNPQINNADTLNISFGNPNLTPSYTHQLGFNMGFYGASWSFTPRITYSRAVKVIERFRTVLASGISQTTFDNVGSNYYLSYIIVGNYKPNKKMSINGNFTLIESSYSSTLNQALNRSGYSVRARLGSSMQLAAKTTFEGSLNYADNLVAQGRNRSSINSSFGLKQNFLKNKLSARVSTTDPFRAKKSYAFNEGTNFYAESFSENKTNNVNFNLTYRFSNVKTNKVVVPPAKKVIGKKAIQKNN